MLWLLLVASFLVSYAQLAHSWSAPSGCYIHIPFCRQRCYYCDFPIKIIGERPSTREAATSAYTETLLKEMRAAFQDGVNEPYLKKNNNGGRVLDTVYFGGGTPSLLRPEQVQEILSEIDHHVGIDSSTEVTLEMDPGTFDRSIATAFKSVGINRVSLGVQSFDDAVLQHCGRAHRSHDAYGALEDLAAVGIDNVSVDLISSLPYVTEKLWHDTLHTTLNSGCGHVSVYDLQVEDKTAFGRWYSPGTFPLPSTETSAAMYVQAVDVLTGGGAGPFEHYEVSNYARPGYRSRHNQKYWRCDATWGFGMGAASYVHGERLSRPGSLGEYTDWVDGLEADGGETTAAAAVANASAKRYHAALKSANVNIEQTEEESEDFHSSTQVGKFVDDPLEVIMLALRTADGLDLSALGSRYGAETVKKVSESLQEYISKGLVSREEKNDVQTVRLEDPQGFLVSNDIIASVFAAFL